MIRKLINILIQIIDFHNKSKVLNFFKKNLIKKHLNIIDIGAHEGETIDFFLKNFKINKIYSFEPNLTLFEELKKKYIY